MAAMMMPDRMTLNVAGPSTPFNILQALIPVTKKADVSRQAVTM